MTVREIVLEWLNAALGRIKKSTAANYRMKAEKHIIPAFGGMDFGMIRSKEIYTFINNKLSDGLSARYVSDMVVLIKSVMKFAEREYGKNNTIKSVSVTKKIRPEVRLLSETEQVILKHHINECRDTTSLGAAFSLYIAEIIRSLRSIMHIFLTKTAAFGWAAAASGHISISSYVRDVRQTLFDDPQGTP